VLAESEFEARLSGENDIGRGVSKYSAVMVGLVPKSDISDLGI
jgi:hypothetical protein